MALVLTLALTMPTVVIALLLVLLVKFAVMAPAPTRLLQTSTAVHAITPAHLALFAALVHALLAQFAHALSIKSCVTLSVFPSIQPTAELVTTLALSELLAA